MKELHSLKTFVWRNCIAHMAAYLIAGALCSYLMNYEQLLTTGNLALIMRQFDSPMVPLGLILQLVNAVPIALVLYFFREKFLQNKNGWKYLFLLMVVFSLFPPQAPAVGTFEGYLYTKFTIREHLLGLPETLLYSLLFSHFLFRWYQKPKRVYSQAGVGLLIMVSLMSILGYLDAVELLPEV